MKKYVLKQNLIIPAGTVFSPAPERTVRDDNHFDTIIGLSKNTHGIVEYCIDEVEELKDWFLEVIE